MFMPFWICGEILFGFESSCGREDKLLSVNVQRTTNRTLNRHYAISHRNAKKRDSSTRTQIIQEYCEVCGFDENERAELLRSLAKNRIETLIGEINLGTLLAAWIELTGHFIGRLMDEVSVWLAITPARG
jgi:hypothetical protein